MLQNQRACQLVRSQTGCEPLALAVAWGARTAGRCAAGVLGAVKHQRFSDQQLETFAARAPGICPKPVCDAGEPCPLPPQDDAVDVSVIVPVHNGERFLRACLDSILHQNTTRRLQVLAVEAGMEVPVHIQMALAMMTEEEAAAQVMFTLQKLLQIILLEITSTLLIISPMLPLSQEINHLLLQMDQLKLAIPVMDFVASLELKMRQYM